MKGEIGPRRSSAVYLVNTDADGSFTIKIAEHKQQTIEVWLFDPGLVGQAG
jgi:hypothetical protein